MDEKKLRGKRRELCRLALARSDIAAALAACDQLVELSAHEQLAGDIGTALMNSLIVSYARPFTEGRPLGKLPDKWSKFSSRHDQETHALLMDLRRQTVAHNDSTLRKVYVAPAGGPLFETGQHTTGLGVAVTSWVPSPERVAAARQLCMTLGTRINDEVERLLDELYGDLPPGGKPFEIPID